MINKILAMKKKEQEKRKKRKLRKGRTKDKSGGKENNRGGKGAEESPVKNMGLMLRALGCEDESLKQLLGEDTDYLSSDADADDSDSEPGSSSEVEATDSDSEEEEDNGSNTVMVKKVRLGKIKSVLSK